MTTSLREQSISFWTAEAQKQQARCREIADHADNRIRTLESLRDDLYRNHDAATDRIRALEAHRDELLAALEACKPHVDVSTGAGTLALIQACAAIRKAQGE